MGVEAFAARVGRINGDDARVFERAVRVEVVIALGDVVQSKDGSILAGDSETDGVRAAIVRKREQAPRG